MLERESTEIENAPKVANQRSFYNHQKDSELKRIDTAAKRFRYAVNRRLVARSAKCI